MEIGLNWIKTEFNSEFSWLW